MSRNLLSGLFIGSLALVLLGCSSAAAPTPTASPTMAPTPSATPAASPSASPTASSTPSSSASTSTSPAAQATISPFNSVAADLTKAIPADLLAGCVAASINQNNILAAMDCTASGGMILTYYQFDTSADLQAAFAADLSNNGASATDNSAAASCGTEDWAGTWDITFGDGKKATGPDFGLICYTSGNGALIEQVDPTVNVRLIAYLESTTPFTPANLLTARANLYQWWQNSQTILSDESRTP